MRKIRVVAWVAVLLLAGFVTGLSGLLLEEEKPSRAYTDKGSGAPSIGGPFVLTTHLGQTFTDADLVGKPYLVFFGFMSCPDVCPTTLLELTGLLTELGEDAERLTLLFITVDPERDTQQLLSAYMTAFDRRIIALHGTSEQTDTAVKAFKAYYEKVPLKDGSYTMNHTAGVLLVSAEGRFIGTLDMHEPRHIRIEKLRRLVKKET